MDDSDGFEPLATQYQDVFAVLYVIDKAVKRMYADMDRIQVDLEDGKSMVDAGMGVSVAIRGVRDYLLMAGQYLDIAGEATLYLTQKSSTERARLADADSLPNGPQALARARPGDQAGSNTNARNGGSRARSAKERLQ
jgi:hypothetical protein